MSVTQKFDLKTTKIETGKTGKSSIINTSLINRDADSTVFLGRYGTYTEACRAFCEQMGEPWEDLPSIVST